MAPSFSPDGHFMAFTSMKRDGFEADKVDIVVMDIAKPEWKRNLTSAWDGTAEGFTWDSTSRRIFFTAPYRGTQQLYQVGIPSHLGAKILMPLSQITPVSYTHLDVYKRQV